MTLCMSLIAVSRLIYPSPMRALACEDWVTNPHVNKP
jgi:hypothetical protein